MTLDQHSLTDALGRLIPWLESWRNSQGAYHGFVVHRTEPKRMGRIHDTAWTQAAIIRGYGNLYRKSREKRWKKAMIQAADLLASRYDPQTGILRYTGHEDDRFHSLVSCALGVTALLSIMDMVDSSRAEKYRQLITDHIRRYWLDMLWVESEGAFKFTAVDFYSTQENRFVVNFNTTAAEALLQVYKQTGESDFRNYALKIGDWLLERWAYTQTFNNALLANKTTVAEDPSSDWMPPGGFSYQFTPSQRDPDNYVTLYTGLSLRGFCALHRETHDSRYAEIIRKQSQFLLDMRDLKTQLFYHTVLGGKVERNPQFIAGAGMTLLGLHEAAPLLEEKAIPWDTLQSILGRVLPNGSYPGFVGKNNSGRRGRGRGGIVWEDVAASVNWNAQWFEYLTRLIEEPAQVALSDSLKTTQITTKRFFYKDTPKTVKILSWWPPKSWGAYSYTKKKATAAISFYPVAIHSRLHEGLLKLQKEKAKNVSKPQA